MEHYKLNIGNIKVYTEIKQLTFDDNVMLRVYLVKDDYPIAWGVFEKNTCHFEAIRQTFINLNILHKDYINKHWLKCDELKKHSDNTFEVQHYDGWSDLYCRIDNTNYFKHFFKYKDNFVIDKVGNCVFTD
jgi:hypothetical protein